MNKTHELTSGDCGREGKVQCGGGSHREMAYGKQVGISCGEEKWKGIAEKKARLSEANVGRKKDQFKSGRGEGDEIGRKRLFVAGNGGGNAREKTE